MLRAGLQIFSKQFVRSYSLWILLIMILLTNSLSAATRTSIAAGGDWNSTATWGGDPVPVAGDDVIIATTGGNVVTINIAGFCNDLTINSGSILTATTYGLTLTGTWKNDGTYNDGTTSTIIFSGTLTKINNGTGSANFQNINIESGAELQINTNVTTEGTFVFAAVTVSSTVTITGTNSLTVGSTFSMPRPSVGEICTFNLGDGTLTVNGTLAMYASSGTNTAVIEIDEGIINLTGNIAISGVSSIFNFTALTGTLNISGSVATGSPTISGSAIVKYNNAGDQPVLATSYHKLQTSGSGIKSLNTGITTITNLLEIDLGTTLNVKTGTLAFAATGSFLTNNGTLDSGTGTINYTAAGDQDVIEISYNNLGISGSGTKTITDGTTLTVAGNFATTLPITFSGATNANIGGIVSGIGAITMGSGTFTVGGSWTNSGITVPGTGEVILNSANPQTMRGIFYKLTLTGGGAKTLTSTTVINNLLTIESGNTLTLIAYGLTFAAANAYVTGAGTLDPGSSTAVISFTSSDDETIPNLAYRNLTFGGAGVKTIATGTTLNIGLAWVISAPTVMDGTASATVGTNVSGTSILTLGTGTITVGGNWTNSAITVFGTSEVIFDSASPQNLRGYYYKLTLRGGGDKTLNNTTVVNNLLTIDSGNILTLTSRMLIFAGANAYSPGAGTLDPGSSTAVISFTGADDETIPDLSYRNLTFGGAGIKTIASGTTLNIGLAWVIGAPTVIDGTANVIVGTSTSGSGTLAMGSGKLSIGVSFGSGAFTPGTGTVNYYRDVSVQNIRTTTYYNLEMTGTGQKNLSSSTTYVTNLLTVDGCILNFSTRALNISGPGTPFQLINGATFVGTSGVTTFSGAADQTIPELTYGGLTFSGAGTKTIQTGQTINITRIWTINSITVMAGTASAIVNTSIAGSGELTMNSGTLTIGGGFVIGTFNPGTGNVHYNGTVSQTVKPTIYHNLEFSDAGTKTLTTGTTTVNNVLTINSGATLSLSYRILTLAGSGNPLIVNGSLIIGTSTVNYAGTLTTNITPISYHHLDGTGGDRVLSPVGTTSLAGLFTPGAGTYTITGSTINFNGTGTQTVPAFNYNNLDLSNGGSGGNRTFDSSGTIGIAGIFTPGDNNHTITGSTIHFNGTGSQTVPAFNYNILNTSNGDRVLANTGTIGIFNTFIPGSGVFTITGSTVDFNSTGTQTIVEFNYNNLTASGGDRTLPDGGTVGIAGVFTPGVGTYTIDNSTIHFNGSSTQTIPTFSYFSLTGSGGDRILDSSGNINIAASFNPGAGSYTVANSIVNFNGSIAQTIPAFTFYKLILSNTNDKSIQNATNVTAHDLEVQDAAVLEIVGTGIINITN